MSAAPPGVVQVPRWMLLGLGLALAGSALTVAFLLGRESARSDSAPTALAIPAAPAAAPRSEPPAAAIAAPQSGAAQAEPVVATSAEMKSTPSSSGRPTDLPPESLAVAAWLDRLGRALIEGKTWTNPDTMAQTILEDALAGRTDGFDRLIAGNQAVHDRILSLTPPPDCGECAGYHAATGAVLADSIRLLRRLRESTASGDLGALAGAQGEAQGLEARAREIERMDQALRKAYGLP